MERNEQDFYHFKAKQYLNSFAFPPINCVLARILGAHLIWKTIYNTCFIKRKLQDTWLKITIIVPYQCFMHWLNRRTIIKMYLPETWKGTNDMFTRLSLRFRPLWMNTICLCVCVWERYNLERQRQIVMEVSRWMYGTELLINTKIRGVFWSVTHTCWGSWCTILGLSQLN